MFILCGVQDELTAWSDIRNVVSSKKRLGRGSAGTDNGRCAGGGAGDG
jgi:hypothetical protein